VRDAIVKPDEAMAGDDVNDTPTAAGVLYPFTKLLLTPMPARSNVAHLSVGGNKRLAAALKVA
jgi:hypothetical protein